VFSEKSKREDYEMTKPQKDGRKARHWGLTPVILANWEAKTGRIRV
jgi:hypothetical protein